MAEQYLVRLIRGYAESEMLAHLSFFVRLGKPKTPAELLETLRTLMLESARQFCEGQDKVLLPDEFFKKLLTLGADEVAYYLDFFENSGWCAFSHWHDVPLTKVVTFYYVEQLLETDEEGNWSELDGNEPIVKVLELRQI